MNQRLPYHVLNTLMIAGGVGLIFNMLNLVNVLMQFRVLHFLMIIFGAVILKMLYGMLKPDQKDPITSNQLANRFFYLGMAVLATSLLLRNYDLPYYQTLLYLDIPLQLVALGISFSDRSAAGESNDEVIDL
ncbi:MAG: hypothetical protein R2780_05680 [Crocinitomicaceae bacterium]